MFKTHFVFGNHSVYRVEDEVEALQTPEEAREEKSVQRALHGHQWWWRHPWSPLWRKTRDYVNKTFRERMKDAVSRRQTKNLTVMFGPEDHCSDTYMERMRRLLRLEPISNTSVPVKRTKTVKHCEPDFDIDMETYRLKKYEKMASEKLATLYMNGSVKKRTWRRWNDEDDMMLERLIRLYGTKDWFVIEEKMGYLRTRGQLQNRWNDLMKRGPRSKSSV